MLFSFFLPSAHYPSLTLFLCSLSFKSQCDSKYISAAALYYYICIGVSRRSALIKKSTWMIHFSSNSPPCERKKVMEKSWDRKLMCMYGSGAERSALFQRSLEAYAQRPRSACALCRLLDACHGKKHQPCSHIICEFHSFPSLAVGRCNSAQ